MRQRCIEEWKLSDNIDLIAFLDGLDDECWKELLTDYVEEKEVVLFQLLAPSRHDSVYDRLLFLWEQLPKKSKDCMTRCLNELLPVYKERHDERALMSIIHVAIYLELPLCETELKDIAGSDSWGIEMRQRAIVALFACKTFDLKNFWASIDLENNPFFLPAYIAFNQFISPLDGLKKLDVLDARPENLEEYELPVKNSLVNVLRHPSWMRGLEDWMKNDYAKWTKAYMKEMIDSYEVLRPLEMKAPLVLTVGISQYPDLMAVKFLEEYGIFERYKLRVEVKEFPWNRILDSLRKKDVDIVIANKAQCLLEMMKDSDLDYLFDFNRNTGMRLIGRKSNEIKALSGKKVLVVENTDASILLKKIQKQQKIQEPKIGNIQYISTEQEALKKLKTDKSVGYYFGNILSLDVSQYNPRKPKQVDNANFSAFFINGCVSMKSTGKEGAIKAFKSAIQHEKLDSCKSEICRLYIKQRGIAPELYSDLFEKMNDCVTYY